MASLEFLPPAIPEPTPLIPPEAGAGAAMVPPELMLPLPVVKPKKEKKPPKPKKEKKEKGEAGAKRKGGAEKGKAKAVKRRKKVAAPQVSEPPEAFQKMPVVQLKKIATDLGLPWVAGKEGIRGMRELLEARGLGVERTWELISCDDELATLDVVCCDPNNVVFQSEGKAWIELSLEFGNDNVDRCVSFPFCTPQIVCKKKRWKKKEIIRILCILLPPSLSSYSHSTTRHGASFSAWRKRARSHVTNVVC